MSWETERKKAGKEPFNWIAMELRRCTHAYGTGECEGELGVTGEHKCFNSWATCQDKEHFNPESFWLRICEAVENIPLNFDFGEEPGLPHFLPLLESLTHDPSMPDPGESLGLRVRFTAVLRDAPHHDIGIDKYALERRSGAAQADGIGYNPQDRSTFIRKLKKRFPHYVGRRLIWYQGYLSDSPSLADFQARNYVQERLDGPAANGRSSLVCNDVLQLLEDKRAQVPFQSRGVLMAELDDETLYNQLDIRTSMADEYDLYEDETVGIVAIGGELFCYTGTEAIANGVRLTGVTREAPAPYATEMATHDEGDLVQRCAFLRGTVPQVVEKVMTRYASIDPSFIPTADWTLEAETWAPETIERLITEPEGCTSVINEIIEQTITWGFWFDEIAQEIKYRAVRPADVDDEVVAITDDSGLVANSVDSVDLPDKIINELHVVFGQIDPTKARDEVENYRTGRGDISGDSQSTNELGQKRTKVIYARWHPAGNAGVVSQFIRRTLNARSGNVAEISYKLERKDEHVRTAQFVDLTTLYLIDVLGLPATTRLQVLQVNARGEELNYRAREDFFRQEFGRLAPDELEGLLWEDATEEQRKRYMFLARADGTFTNGDRGKALA